MPIRVLLVLLIVVALVTNLITPYMFELLKNMIPRLRSTVPRLIYDYLGAFFFGLKFSEYSLLGFALAYFPMPRFQRAAFVFGLTTLFLIVFMIGLQAWDFPFLAAVILTVGSWAGVALIGVLATILKRAGWTIQHASLSTTPEKQSQQFNIRFLLYLMVGVGFFTAMLKMVLPKKPGGDLSVDLPSICLWLLWLFCSISVVLLLTVFALLHPKPGRARIMLLLLMIFGPLLFHWVASIILSQSQIAPLKFTFESLALVYSVVIGIFGGMSVVLLPLRRTGYRLTKIP